jgi:hypothetical protein
MLQHARPADVNFFSVVLGAHASALNRLEA